MKSLKDGWYVAGADGDAAGPMTRAQMLDAHARGGFPPDALVWHVEIAEWRPIASAGLASPAADAARSAASAQSGIESRLAYDEPPAARPAQPKQSAAQRRAQAQQRRKSAGGSDNGQRLLSASDAKRKQALDALQAATQATGAATARSSLPPGPEARGRAGNKAAGKDSSASAAAALECLRRFFARAIDTLSLGVVGAIVAWHYATRSGIGGPEMPDLLGSAPAPLALWLIAFLVMVPLEALMLAVAGTTPGKALLGLRVVAGDGGRASPLASVRRALDVYLRGLGLGIPVLAFFTMLVAGARRLNHGRTHWDQAAGTAVVAAPLSGGRWQLALMVFIAAWVALSAGLWEQLLFGSGLLQ
jgi:uncharacterized RDD family membrane protein YckC